MRVACFTAAVIKKVGTGQIVDREAVQDQFYGKEVVYADSIDRVIDCQHFHIHGVDDKT